MSEQVFHAYACDKEGSWFFQGTWPMTALEPDHTDHAAFRKVLDTYPTVNCYQYHPGDVQITPFAAFTEPQAAR